MKLLLLIVLTVVFKVCCNSESETCCRDYHRLNESVSDLLQRVNELEVESRRMKKEIKELKKLNIKPECPQDFEMIRHSCYLLVKDERTKRDASRYCRRKSCSHLVRIQSEGEIERLIKYLDEDDVPSILFTAGYLNASLIAGVSGGSANWIWSKSKPIKFSSWNKLGILPVQFVKNQTPSCVVLSKTGNDWVLKSEYCKEKRAFICEKRKIRQAKPRRIRH